MRTLRWAPAVALATSAWLVSMQAAPVGRALQERRAVSIAPGNAASVRQWNREIDRMVRTGDLQLAETAADTVLPWRSHQRLRQYYMGVPVFGGDVTRELDNGVPLSMIGFVYAGIGIDPVPRLTAFDAQSIVERLSGQTLGPSRAPRLVILPGESGDYVLAYDVQVATPEDVTRYFVDANNGEIASQYSNAQTQAASVGKGTGVLGDQKKVMSALLDGTYYTNDRMRPAAIYTYDMKQNISRMLDVLNGRVQPGWSDVASDSDNVWTDGPVVDAQVYAGFTYDYFYRRMGRKGLDDNNLAMKLYVHPIDRNNLALYSQYSLYFTNAFYNGKGTMVFGEGLPPNATAGGRYWKYTSSAIDIVAHELSHGVTDYSSNLIYQGESGALNEAFSDIMSIAIEFFFQGVSPDVNGGTVPRRGDYVAGEDAVTPGGIRNFANPRSKGHPDHYSIRYTGTSDGGGVHTNSLIASHAFYLAIEGGTNQTSQLSVQGVGGSNREQIEKIFYRAFVYKLPSNATFATARLATIEAARDLYGPGSAAERAIIQAWDAVGVDVGVTPALTGEPIAERARALSAGKTGVALSRIRQ